MVKRLREGLACTEHPDASVWTTMYGLMGYGTDAKGGGFGWYETFIHIDDRGQDGDDAVMWDNSNNKYDDFYMDSEFYRLTYVSDFCDEMPRVGKKKPGIIRILESLFSRFPRYTEDGALSYINRIIQIVTVAILSIVGFLVYKKVKK